MEVDNTSNAADKQRYLRKAQTQHIISGTLQIIRATAPYKKHEPTAAPEDYPATNTGLLDLILAPRGFSGWQPPMRAFAHALCCSSASGNFSGWCGRRASSLCYDKNDHAWRTDQDQQGYSPFDTLSKERRQGVRILRRESASTRVSIDFDLGTLVALRQRACDSFVSASFSGLFR